MNDVEKSLFEALADAKPDRFRVHPDEEYDGELWQFDDKELKVSLHDRSIHWWMSRVLESLPIAYITKIEGLTWDESILNAIVLHFQQEQA